MNPDSGISSEMNVPRHIRPLSTTDETFVPAFGGAGLSNSEAHAARDRMIVPDRIIVAGGDETIADKPPPREIALDMQTYGPGRFVESSLLETPPDKLTLYNRAFPTIDEADFRLQQQRGQEILKSPKQQPDDSIIVEKTDRVPSEKHNHSSDSLPSTAAMSVLSPSEELVLLRNQVRKLTTRLQKLEEEVQDTNRTVSWIQFLGGGFVVFLVIKSVLSHK